MGSKDKGPGETSAQRAASDVAMQRVTRWRTTLAPLLQVAAKKIDAIGDPNSAATIRAKGMASNDSDVAFAGANQRQEAEAASAGQFGQSRQKLGLTGLGRDQSVSTGLNQSRVNSGLQDARVGGLSQIVAMGQGQEARAAMGLEQVGQMSAQQANADAEIAANRRAGYAQLAGQSAGLAIGAYGGKKPDNPGWEQFRTATYG